ncbi:hypothetical protein CVT26_002633 [Gymnopilus dilepis]|uniref:Uncharacterized protein n=1 Tax=Gymnopilus dilepis TaxID=231916 RepID=A0A409VCH5_9AGAR|nr:hypothetical protein CVT26_002633 [Gymnopilus dilepis]
MADPPESEVDVESEISTSRGSSIDGPYRQAKVQNTFPQCHLVHSIYGSEETYSRSLLSTGNGFAFWNAPEGHVQGPTRLEQLEETQTLGISIGDVGTIDPSGQFIFGFNIFTPATDPRHQGRLPDEFEEIQPVLDKASEIQLAPDFFKPGTIVSSKGVNVNQVSEAPLKASFWSSAREGAVLVLPHGGSREDLKSTSRLSDYIEKYALEWYRYLSKHSDGSASMIPNGSVFLVTGCDKAQSFCSVSFPSDWKNAGRRIEMTYEREEYPSWFPTMLAEEKNVDLAEGAGRQFCVFARGIHISISNRLWARHLPYPTDPPYYNILSTPVLGLRATLARFREHFMRKPDASLSGHEKLTMPLAPNS